MKFRTDKVQILEDGKRNRKKRIYLWLLAIGSLVVLAEEYQQKKKLRKY